MLRGSIESTANSGRSARSGVIYELLRHAPAMVANGKPDRSAPPDDGIVISHREALRMRLERRKAVTDELLKTSRQLLDEIRTVLLRLKDKPPRS